MKTTIDLEQFTNVLPYSSELFGVYQPILGWKSKRIVGRFKAGFFSDINNFQKDVFRTIRGDIEYQEDIDLRRAKVIGTNVNSAPVKTGKYWMLINTIEIPILRMGARR